MPKKRTKQTRPAAALTPILYCGDPHIEAVQTRIHYKMQDYAAYRFTSRQSCAINIFFDLAQEFEEISRLHLLAVLVLRMFFQLETELYTKNDKDELVLRTPKIPTSPAVLPPLRPEIWLENNCRFIPVRGKSSVFLPGGQRLVSDENLLGLLVVDNSEPLETHDLLFLEKFANRVGFCLHNKMLAERNSRHILFVRKLVHDIGHNVITPNIRLKLMLNRLEGQVAALGDLCRQPPAPEIMDEMLQLQGNLEERSKAIMGYFKNGAMFLESLLRQSHFDLGHYVLRCTRLDLRSLVAVPQFERYRSHLLEKDIHIGPEQPVLPGTPCTVQADLGLISQVLANLLSNAVKYCAPPQGGKNGEVRCKVEIIPDAFPDKTPGVKVSVFTTGPPLPQAEGTHLFNDNYRASNAANQYGTGHGLYFVREIVAEHGGRSGYDALKNGNEFYFILPFEL